MHSIFQLYVCTLPYMRGLDASRKFLAIKVVVGLIVFQQLVVNSLLSADVIPEGKYGYAACGVFVTAGISVRSPRKIFICIIKKCIYRL